MITGNKDSKNSANSEFVDIRKYIGVASVSILCINPDNAKLRSYGWQIPEAAKEQEYVKVDDEGKKSFRLRLLAQIHDLDDKPVIALDFNLSPEVYFNKDKTKCQIIDEFGRTAWCTKDELQAKAIPQYKNGPADIAKPYYVSHKGQASIVAFLFKLLNVTPLKIFDRVKNNWVPTKNPGRITIENWANLCSGNISEIAAALSLQPDNRVKVILGVQTSDENKTYQTFLMGDIKSGAYLGNGSIPDRTTGEYTNARKAIDKYMTSLREYADVNPEFAMPNLEFSAAPVKVWNISATEVTDNAETNDAPSFNSPEYTKQDDNDLPFGPGDAF